MKFSSKYKIELVASTDSHRFILENVRVDIYDDRPVLVGTDGRMIAVVPCQVDSIHEIGLVSKEALAAARKACRPLRRNTESEVSIELNGEATVREGQAVHSFKRMEGNYPNWQTLPQLQKQEGQRFSVSLNPEMLLKLAKAIGAKDGVTIEVQQMNDRFHTNSLTVRPYQGANELAFGILMPLSNRNQ